MVYNNLPVNTENMTDSSALIANQQALTSDVLYSLKPSVVRCRAYRASIPPSNTKNPYVAGDAIIAYVPARRNCFLDTATSYMRVTVKNSSTTNALNIDSTISSLISRLDIYHGSNLLETIQSYNVLVSALVDLQTDKATRDGLEAVWGCTGDRTGTSIATSQSMTFCMPIISGTVGVLNDKYLPLSISDDIRCEFTLDSNDVAMCCAASTGATWQVTSFELVANILELSDEGMQMVSQVTPFTQPIYMHGTSYRHTSATLGTTAQGAQTVLVPARFASLKMILCVPRRATEIGQAHSYSISSHINPGIQSFSYRVGSLMIPQKPITLVNSSTTGGYAESFAETLRSFNLWNNISFAPSITRAQYNVADAADTNGGGVVVASTTSNSKNNAFVLSSEFESCSNRNDVMLSGVNTLNLTVFHDMTLGSTNLSASWTLNYFAQYDHILVLDPTGIYSVKF